MPKDLNLWRRPRYLLVAVSLTAAFAAPGMVAAAGSNETANHVLALETHAHALTEQVAGLSETLGKLLPGAQPAAESTPPVLVAQSERDLASLNLRVSQLEEQLRSLTGQIEGLQFQMTQFQTLLERMQEDNDARFSALEGGAAPGKTKAAPQAGGATPSGGEPQTQDLAPPAGGSGDLSVPGDPGAPTDLTAPDQDAQAVTLGSPEQPLGTLSQGDLSTGLGQPLDMSHDAGGIVTDADANAQYQAGYEAAVRGDYAFAEDQFRQFIALFPDHPQAPEATNWLGEALIQQGNFDEAADILLTGFQSYPNSPRAPDMLLKLGVALSGAGEQETACRTFGEVQKRFPNQSQGFQTRLANEMAKAGC